MGGRQQQQQRHLYMGQTARGQNRGSHQNTRGRENRRKSRRKEIIQQANEKQKHALEASTSSLLASPHGGPLAAFPSSGTSWHRLFLPCSRSLTLPPPPPPPQYRHQQHQHPAQLYTHSQCGARMGPQRARVRPSSLRPKCSASLAHRHYHTITPCPPPPHTHRVPFSSL